MNNLFRSKAENKRGAWKQVFFVTLFMGVFYFLFCQGVFAQEAGQPEELDGVQVSPTRFDWDLVPLNERTGRINLKNYTKEVMRVEIAIEDFFVSDDSTEAHFFVPNKEHPLYAYDVINWITPKSDEIGIIEIPADGNKDVLFTIKIPEKTPTGGYYGAIFFRTLPNVQENEEDGARIGISTRVGVLMVMAVKGDEPLSKKGEIKDFQGLRKVYFSPPAEFATDFFNSGNIHYKVSGSVKIKKFSKDLLELPIESRIVYPGKNRTFKNSWRFTNWSYGYYKAVVDISSEDDLVKDSREIAFWVIPWKTTVSIILLIIIIWIILRLFTQKFEIKRKGNGNEAMG